MKAYLNKGVSARVLLFLKVFNYWIIFLILAFMAASESVAIFSREVHLFVYAMSGATIAFVVEWIFIRAERKSQANYNLVWQRDTILKFLKGIAIAC